MLCTTVRIRTSLRVKKKYDDLLKRRPKNFSRSFYQQSTNAIFFLNFALKYEQDMHFISILIIYL